MNAEINDTFHFSVSEKSKAQSKKDGEKTKEEQSSIFQRQRVDMLLGELLRKFPPPVMNPVPVPIPNANPPTNGDTNPESNTNGTAIKQENDTDTTKTTNEKASEDFKLPEKKMKMN